MTADTLHLSDGRAISIEVTAANEVTVTGDVPRLAPSDAGMLGQGIERAAVFAGQLAAQERMRGLAAPRRTIEQIAEALAAASPDGPPEPADAALHAPSCDYRRNWACNMRCAK